MSTVLELDPQATAAVGRAIDALAGRRIAVLTGAGVSTDSGIPDYRGKGAPTRTPMTAQQFLASESARRRYWVGSHLGWRAFAASSPNGGHAALAELERGGVASGIITQNVDGLHLRAGSRRVVELHGTMRRVVCTRCGQVFDRRDLAARVEADNPWITVPENVELGPDGDVLPSSSDGFVVPECSVCRGMLKPDVVFFGESVPVERVQRSFSLVEHARLLLVLGSSLTVMSGRRFVIRAAKVGVPVAIVNQGPTRGDDHATLRLDAPLGESLTTLVRALVPGKSAPNR